MLEWSWTGVHLEFSSEVNDSNRFSLKGTLKDTSLDYFMSQTHNVNKVPLASCSHQTSRVHSGSRETSGTSHWFQCSMFIFHIKFNWNYFFIYKQKKDRKKAKPEPNWSLTGVTLETPGQCRRVEDTPVNPALWRWWRWYQRQRSIDQRMKKRRITTKRIASNTPMAHHWRRSVHTKKTFSVKHPIKSQLTVSSKAWTVA